MIMSDPRGPTARHVAEHIAAADMHLAGGYARHLVVESRRVELLGEGCDRDELAHVAAEGIVQAAEALHDAGEARRRDVNWAPPPALADIRLASDFPGYGDDLRPPGGKQL